MKDSERRPKTEKRRLWPSRALVAGVLVGSASITFGCSASTAKEGGLNATTDGSDILAPSTGSYSVAEIHVREQEAVRECMLRAGFEYKPIPRDTYTPRSIHSLILLSDHASRGYGALFEVFRLQLTSMGQPPAEFTPAETQKYDKALLGDTALEDVEEHSSEDEGGSHDEHEGEGGDEAGVDFGGCMAEGMNLRADLEASSQGSTREAIDAERAQDAFMEAFVGSATYGEFVAGWRSCMANTGKDLYEPLGQFLVEVERMEPAVMTYFEDNPTQLSDFRDPAVIDEAWFAGLLDRSEELQELYDDELEAAAVDAACRAEAIQPVAADLDALSQEMLGVPFDQA